ELLKRDGPLAVVKGKGETEGGTTVSAQVLLHCSNLRERNPALAKTDERLLNYLRVQWGFLGGAFAQGGGIRVSSPDAVPAANRHPEPQALASGGQEKDTTP